MCEYVFYIVDITQKTVYNNNNNNKKTTLYPISILVVSKVSTRIQNRNILEFNHILFHTLFFSLLSQKTQIVQWQRRAHIRQKYFISIGQQRVSRVYAVNRLILIIFKYNFSIIFSLNTCKLFCDHWDSKTLKIKIKLVLELVILKLRYYYWFLGRYFPCISFIQSQIM